MYKIDQTIQNKYSEPYLFKQKGTEHSEPFLVKQKVFLLSVFLSSDYGQVNVQCYRCESPVFQSSTKGWPPNELGPQLSLEKVRRES